MSGGAGDTTRERQETQHASAGAGDTTWDNTEDNFSDFVIVFGAAYVARTSQTICPDNGVWALVCGGRAYVDTIVLYSIADSRSWGP